MDDFWVKLIGAGVGGSVITAIGQFFLARQKGKTAIELKQLESDAENIEDVKEAKRLIEQELTEVKAEAMMYKEALKELVPVVEFLLIVTKTRIGDDPTMLAAIQKSTEHLEKYKEIVK